MAGDSEPIIRPRIARRKLVECTETAQQQCLNWNDVQAGELRGVLVRLLGTRLALRGEWA
jgi:hypothetical protein